MKLRATSLIVAGAIAAIALLFKFSFDEGRFSREGIYGDTVAENLRAHANNSLGFHESAPVQGSNYLYRFEFGDSFKLADRLRVLGFEVAGGGLIAEHSLRAGHANLNKFLLRNENAKWIPDGFVAKEIWNYRGNIDTLFRVIIIGVDERSGTKYAFMLSGK